VAEIQKNAPHVMFGTTTTVGWPNLWNALELIDHCIDTRFIDPNLIHINILQTPSIYSLTSLPEFKKIVAKERIELTLKKLSIADLEENLLFSNLKGIIQFMYSQSTESSLSQFNKVTSRLDQRRSEDFFQAFPEHADLQESLR
jgi:hypothetical protein